jgi:thymidine phosphorylase
MDTPLGRAVGNALEVAEAVEVLSGRDDSPDLVELTLALAREMLELAGIQADPSVALRNGSALERYRAMVVAQGGDPDAPLPRAAHIELVTADQTGIVGRLDARAVGVAAWRLGAGRARKEDAVSASAGVVCRIKPGEKVTEGQALLELHTDQSERLDWAREALKDAIAIGDQPPAPTSVVLEVIS